jgi:hypothetical protein
MKIRDLIITGGTILTAILMIMVYLWDNFPIFVLPIPLCIMVICFVIDSLNDYEDNWFDKKL